MISEGEQVLAEKRFFDSGTKLPMGKGGGSTNASWATNRDGVGVKEGVETD